eukprot:719975-Pelagomonas_calceolata.AAC.3
MFHIICLTWRPCAHNTCMKVLAARRKHSCSPGVVAGACTDGLWHGGSGCTSQLSTAQVGISQLHALDVLLLSHHHVAELHQDGQGHAGLVEGDLALAAVHQALAHVLQADVGDEVAHLQQRSCVQGMHIRGLGHLQVMSTIRGTRYSARAAQRESRAEAGRATSLSIFC